MKKLEKLKLSQLSENALNARQQDILKGGAQCNCTCSTCGCTSWDGTGPITPGHSSTDMGMGTITRDSTAMRASYLCIA
ncbi:TIGR04149 family rSAM-modified RiPP [Parabacteroides chinchillae]|uniref:TIGR04149 family rSAM-modified RiPP n=1 Tax=Parabacteroides chinchillae TaxID=871327 RepID=UPI000CDEF027